MIASHKTVEAGEGWGVVVTSFILLAIDLFSEAEHVSATEETPMIKLDTGGGETLQPETTDEAGILQDENGG